MKYSHFGPLVTLIASFSISVPGSLAQNATTIETAAPVRLTVAPTAPSLILMKTLPKAACVLHAEGATDAEPSFAEHSFKVFADDEGTIRFHVNPSAESDQTARFAVDCTVDGKSSTFPLELRPNSSPTFDMPAPAAEVVKSRPGDIIRPALSKSDVANLSGDELAKRGYPQRPDPKNAPDAYATWLQAVTKPAKFVPSRQVARPEVRHLPPVTGSNFETTGNWSGYELRGPANSYDLLMGEWYVPTVYYETNKHVYSAYWIGLDGDGTSDLWQAGTEQEITDVVIIGLHFDFTNYYAWTEFLPPQATEQVIPNFTVNPGDLMFSQVFIGNVGQSASLSGSYAVATVEDLTRGEYTTIYTCRGLTLFGACFNIGQTNVGGSEAEWIMERPTVSGSLPDLADYNYSYMYDAYAMQTNGYWMNYDGANNQQIFMYNGNDLLSGAFPSSTSTMLFYWYNFH